MQDDDNLRPPRTRWKRILTAVLLVVLVFRDLPFHSCPPRGTAVCERA